MPEEPSGLQIPVSLELPTSGDPARRAAIDSLVFASGDVIAGKYRVERQLAVGGMGVVYACTDSLLDRPVALKVIHPDIAEDESIRERFLLEARTLARLSNPHVTRVYECGYTEGGQPYIVMELLHGTDLYSVIKSRGTLTSERVARLGLQVCRGLRDAHALGIVHRDLKPENLFITHTRNGTELVKILDFGISKQSRLTGRRSLTNPSMHVGSPHYMPPEQVRSPSTVDGRADIWALGVVLFEALTGQVPFEGSSLPELCQALLSAPIPSLGQQVRPDLARVVHRCLERDLDARYPDVDALENDLRAVLDQKRKPTPRPVLLSDMVTPSPMEKVVLPPELQKGKSRGKKLALSLVLCAATAFGTFHALRAGIITLPDTLPTSLKAAARPPESESKPERQPAAFRAQVLPPPIAATPPLPASAMPSAAPLQSAPAPASAAPPAPARPVPVKPRPRALGKRALAAQTRSLDDDSAIGVNGSPEADVTSPSGSLPEFTE